MKKLLSNLVVVAIKNDVMDFLMEILDDIAAAGFILLHAKTVCLTEKKLHSLYKKHEKAEWFSTFISFLKDKEMHVIIFQKKNAVPEFKKIKGHKDPYKAERGTLRKRYGTTVLHNGVDSSSSPQETLEKIKFFFPKFEIEEGHEARLCGLFLFMG